MEYTYQMLNEKGDYIGKQFTSPVLFRENQRVNMSNAAYVISSLQFNIVQNKQSTIYLVVRRL